MIIIITWACTVLSFKEMCCQGRWVCEKQIWTDSEISAETLDNSVCENKKLIPYLPMCKEK